MNLSSTKNDEQDEFLAEKPIWTAVWAMSICVMVLVASEFLPVSLLTPIASDLGMTEGQAGQSISISGLFALMTSLFLTSMIGKIDRRHVLLFFTALVVLSGIIVTFAPNDIVFMAGRALIGVCIGGFWSMSAATVMRLVPKDSVSKALAILNGGNAVSTTVAAPLGSFLGGLIGWRGAFFCVVPIAVIAFIWQWATLPKLPARKKATSRLDIGNVFGLLIRPLVAVGMLSSMLFFMGQFALFTYLRPFLETVTGVGVQQLSLLLLAMGGFGLIGTFLIGAILKERLYSLLIVIPVLMMVTSGAIIALGHSLAAMYVLLSAWGLLGTSAPVAWWAWLSKTLPDDAEAGGGLMVAIIQFAITMGAAIGGLVFDSYGYAYTFSLSAMILLAASLTAFVAWRLEQKDLNLSAVENPV